MVVFARLHSFWPAISGDYFHTKLTKKIQSKLNLPHFFSFFRIFTFFNDHFFQPLGMKLYICTIYKWLYQSHSVYTLLL